MQKRQPLIAIALPHEIGHKPLPCDVPVVYTGVGKLNAALSVATAIERFKPSMLINFGTAGSVAGRASGLVEVADVLQRDMDAEPLFPRGITPFDDTPALLQSGYDGVRCATGDSFVRESDPWLIERAADVVDMELFALALVCHQNNLAWRSFKFVTDNADENSGEDWQDRVHLGRELFLQRLAGLAV